MLFLKPKFRAWNKNFNFKFEILSLEYHLNAKHFNNNNISILKGTFTFKRIFWVLRQTLEFEDEKARLDLSLVSNLNPKF